MNRVATGCAFLLLLAASGRPSKAEKLTVALSADRVEISSNFTGTAMAVFGAIERDAGTVSRGEGYDLVLVVRGPPQTVVTRRKERFLGIWVNRRSETYRAPAFYSAHATRRIASLALPAVLNQNQIGLSAVHLSGSASPDFAEGFLRLKQKEGLYNEEVGDIRFLAPTIFQTSVSLPANVPIGMYTATVYLFSGSAFLGEAEQSFTVAKSRFEQFTSGFARNQGLIYGLVTIVLALVIGWLAGVIFRRD